MKIHSPGKSPKKLLRTIIEAGMNRDNPKSLGIAERIVRIGRRRNRFDLKRKMGAYHFRDARISGILWKKFENVNCRWFRKGNEEKIEENYQRITDERRSFDIRFWQSRGDRAIFNAVLEMLHDYFFDSRERC